MSANKNESKGKGEGKQRQSLFQEYGNEAGQVLKMGIVQTAEKLRVPKRFKCVMHDTKPQVKLTDTQTGRSVQVSLCDYSGVRKVLAALFGEL